MSDQRDRCAICLDTFARLDSHRPLSWPCGHRVHIACILQSQASLRSVEAPCFVCRTPPFPYIRSFLEQWHGEVIACVEAGAPPDVPAEDPPVPVNAVYIPRTIAALCCPRVLPYSADGAGGRTVTRFVEIQNDRRMTFMGLDRGTGALQWTCLSCNQQLSMMGMPGPEERAAHVCHRHGAMCFTFDCQGERAVRLGAEPEEPYWSCMDHRASLGDVPLPISHFLCRNDVRYAGHMIPFLVR